MLCAKPAVSGEMAEMRKRAFLSPSLGAGRLDEVDEALLPCYNLMALGSAFDAC
jgi:hypothetical protein